TGETLTPLENSEVLLPGSVAVAVMKRPRATGVVRVTEKLAWPAPSVVTVIDLIVVIPHTMAVRGDHWDWVLSKRFLKSGVFTSSPYGHKVARFERRQDGQDSGHEWPRVDEPDAFGL